LSVAVEPGRDWRSDLYDMARLALPVVFINLGIQAMGVIDALMVGKLGGAAIAAVALGNFYFFNASVFGMGLLCAIDPVVAQAVGAGDHDGVARGVQRGFVLAALVSVVVLLALLPVEWMLLRLDQPLEVVKDGGVHTSACAGDRAILRLHRIPADAAGNGPRSAHSHRGGDCECCERDRELAADFR
jgi:MATE family multidrug resistance protein